MRIKRATLIVTRDRRIEHALYPIPDPANIHLAPRIATAGSDDMPHVLSRGIPDNAEHHSIEIGGMELEACARDLSGSEALTPSAVRAYWLGASRPCLQRRLFVRVTSGHSMSRS